jgi:hypothetical protein
LSNGSLEERVVCKAVALPLIIWGSTSRFSLGSKLRVVLGEITGVVADVGELDEFP